MKIYCWRGWWGERENTCNCGILSKK